MSDDIRPVFYVSDGTGITAETIGHSLLTQFQGTRFVTDRIPFVDNVDKARKAAEEIRRVGLEHGTRPIVVNSSIDPELNALLAESGALMLDIFAPFIEPLERELGRQRHSRVGQAHVRQVRRFGAVLPGLLATCGDFCGRRWRLRGGFERADGSSRRRAWCLLVADTGARNALVKHLGVSSAGELQRKCAGECDPSHRGLHPGARTLPGMQIAGTLGAV